MGFPSSRNRLHKNVLTDSRTFFKNELAVLRVQDQKQTPQKFKGVRFNIVATLNSIGEGIIDSIYSAGS